MIGFRARSRNDRESQLLKDAAGTTTKYEADAMFVEKALTPNSDMVKDLVQLDGRGHVIVARRAMPLPILKKLRRPSGADQAAAPERNADRAVVAGRGPRRPADQAHPTLGEARHPALGAQGSAAVLGMAVRCDLSR